MNNGNIAISMEPEQRNMLHRMCRKFDGMDLNPKNRGYLRRRGSLKRLKTELHGTGNDYIIIKDLETNGFIDIVDVDVHPSISTNMETGVKEVFKLYTITLTPTFRLLKFKQAWDKLNSL